MTDDLAELGRVVGDLLVATAPLERRRLLRTVARELRRSQAARIARQQNPDGSAFAARKPKDPRFRRQGRIKAGAMFRKLRLARNLKMGATGEEAWVGFVGRAARIARPHQDGAIDRASPEARPVRYARRVLLGLTDAERRRMLDTILDHVTASV